MNGADKKYRLLLIGPLPPPVGGVASIYHCVSNSSMKDTFDLRILDIRGGSSRRYKENIGKLSIGKVLMAVVHLFKLIWLLLSFKPHMVYMSFNSTRLAGFRDSVFLRLIHSFKIKAIVRFCNCNFQKYYEKGSRRRRKRVLNTLMKVHALQVQNQQMYENVHSVLKHNNYFMFPNGVDGDQLLNIAEMKSNKPAARNVLFMGRVVVQKGVLDLIEAFDRIAATDSRYQLTIAGPFGGNDRFLIRERADKSPFKSRIRFTGTVTGEEKLKAFREADLFAFPTHHEEGSSNALIEALAAGLPTVTCDIGGVASTVIDGEGAIFVPIGQPEELAKGIETLFNNTDMYERFSRQNVLRFKKMFTKDIFISNITRMILGACHDRS
jgi:glycosyltransferase involved in cell wall biosynthesis